MQPDILLLDLNTFKIKYIYDQYTRINHLSFYTLYLLFQTSCMNFPPVFNL